MAAVWVFNGEHSPLPAGVFGSRKAAVSWIREHGLTGTLSEFPLDEGAYDHAVTRGLFTPRKPHESEPDFVARFSPRLGHEHWRDGNPS